MRLETNITRTFLVSPQLLYVMPQSTDMRIQNCKRKDMYIVQQRGQNITSFQMLFTQQIKLLLFREVGDIEIFKWSGDIVQGRKKGSRGSLQRHLENIIQHLP